MRWTFSKNNRRSAGLTDRTVVALLVHAVSSFVGAIEGAWLIAELWPARGLPQSEDIPVAAGAVGPPALISMMAMLLSVGASLYAASVLISRARAERREAPSLELDRRPYFIAGAWLGALVVSMLPAVLIRGNVLDSALLLLRVSYWGSASSIGMLVVDLSLAGVVAMRLCATRGP